MAPPPLPVLSSGDSAATQYRPATVRAPEANVTEEFYGRGGIVSTEMYWREVAKEQQEEIRMLQRKARAFDWLEEQRYFRSGIGIRPGATSFCVMLQIANQTPSSGRTLLEAVESATPRKCRGWANIVDATGNAWRLSQ